MSDDDDEVIAASNDADLSQLDDIADREELRRRYYGLLQELRVVIPGVQVLLAFLLTAPFAQRFDELDGFGTRAYGIALFSALVSVLCLLTPTVLHRLGERTARRARLRVAIWLTIAGLGALSLSLLAALWCITRLVYSPNLALAAEIAATAILLLLWLATPLYLRRLQPTGNPEHLTDR
jgi:hypothetical protein